MGEEDKEVAAANIAVNVVISSEDADGAAEVRPHPPLLPLHLVAAGCCLLVARGVLAEFCNQH
jgi:hypothetical protein